MSELAVTSYPNRFVIPPGSDLTLVNPGRSNCTMDYTRSDMVQKQIEEAVKDRWLALRNKIIDELRDQMADDQLQEVLQIVDNEQWFPRFAQAIQNGEEA